MTDTSLLPDAGKVYEKIYWSRRLDEARSEPARRISFLYAMERKPPLSDLYPDISLLVYQALAIRSTADVQAILRLSSVVREIVSTCPKWCGLETP